MITYKTGDILSEDAEALVNTVNCFGIMGRGIALQFKKAFPANLKAYEDACKHGEVQPGRMFGFETPFGLELLSTVHWVANRKPVNTVNDVIAHTYAWGDRKRRFSERQLQLALDRLVTKTWLISRLLANQP